MSRVGAEVVEEGAPSVLLDQIESGGGTGADSGHVTAYGGWSGIAAVVGTAAGDVTAGTVDEWFGWRTGLGAVIAGVEAEAGMWTGWADVAGGAET